MAPPKDNVILSWMAVEDESELDSCDSKNESDARTEYSDHETNTDQSAVEDEQLEEDTSEMEHSQAASTSSPSTSNVHQTQCLQVNRQPMYYVGKDPCTKWLVHRPTNIRNTKTTKENIILSLPGVKAIAKNKETPLDCWKIFFPDETINRILIYTNQELLKMSESYSRGQKDCPQTDFEELSAFIGILYMLGVKKANHAHTSEMWATDGTSPEYFRAIMSERRFHTLVRGMRFDNKDTRRERQKQDNLAAFREVFEEFVKRSIASYSPGEYVVIDEMLEAFRGKCKFRQYIGNKPDKYGVKIYALVDSRTFYTLNMEVYCGKQPVGPYEKDNDAASVVKRLIKPIDGSGRNLTTDNYYTSVPLANDLFVNHKITTVGTIRKNKPQIPEIFKDVKTRPVCSSVFGFKTPANHTLLVSYVPKKSKNVLLISTFHTDDSIDASTNEFCKPEVITFYNLTKGGVDVVDRMKKEYSVKRISNRWPMTLFNGLLNLGTINSQVIFKSNTGNLMPRRTYITELAKQLATPHLMKRSSIESLPSSLKQSIKNVTGKDPPRQETPQGNQMEKIRCGYCPKRKNRFTQHKCESCQTPLCKEHTATTRFTCTNCNDGNFA